MLKSQVPVYLCSAAFTITLISAEGRRELTHSMEKKTLHAASVKAKSVSLKKTKISMTPPDKQGIKFVHNYIKRNGECLFDVKQKSAIPFTIIDSVFRHYGLPVELKYLAVIESELKSSAVSAVGAKGPWQLMPRTAHILGLKVNRHSDERINYYKSTRAAARYLRDLHREFGDWLLVLAAYNGGPAPVYKAIHKSHSKNFWVLQKYLPAESRDHVKKFIATDCYFEGQTGVKTESKPSIPVQDKKFKNQIVKVQESADEKFNRLMNESSKSLQRSHEILETVN